MKRLLKPFTRNATPVNEPLLNIVIAQYIRPGFDSVGDEHEFHWAIVVVEDLVGSASARCRCYQAFNAVVPGKARAQPLVGWHVRVNREAVLANSSKYRGGVVIGTVPKSKLESLDKVC